MKHIFLFFILFLFVLDSNSQNNNRTKNFPKLEIKVSKKPKKENVWVYLMAGQSNMAGRGFVEAQDTIHNKRILTINKRGDLIYAKEPLHFYEPSLTGLDLGMSFGREIITKIPDSISVLIIPTAVGGSAIEQWLEDKKRKNVQLLTNFRNKVEIAESYGDIKGILWHQGESNTKSEILISKYDKQLHSLFIKLREITKKEQLPIVIGELGCYTRKPQKVNFFNKKLKKFAKKDQNVSLVKTGDLTDRGDKLHFDAKSIRIMGKRYAKKILKMK